MINSVCVSIQICLLLRVSASVCSAGSRTSFLEQGKVLLLVVPLEIGGCRDHRWSLHRESVAKSCRMRLFASNGSPGCSRLLLVVEPVKLGRSALGVRTSKFNGSHQ